MPDTYGLDCWTMAKSKEFAGLCGGLGNRAFVDAPYQSMLHRAGDPIGCKF